MIPPATVTKTAARDAEKPAPAAGDPAQWRQAIAAATAAIPPALVKNIPVTAKKAATASLSPIPVEIPITAKKTVPATTGSPAAVQVPVSKKTSDTPMITANILLAPPADPPPAGAKPVPVAGQTHAPDGAQIHAPDGAQTHQAIAANLQSSTAPIAIAQAAPNPQPPPARQTLLSPEKQLPAHEAGPSNSVTQSIAPPAVTTSAASIAVPQPPEKIPEKIIEKPSITAMTGIAPSAATSLPSSALATGISSAPPPSAPAPITANAAGLAAAITAMHQSGQSTATMRLDPPGLGSLTIHLGLGQNDSVNVLFITAVPQTGQIIANHLNDLRQAMENTGLSLGNTQVGSGNAGGQSANNGKPQNPPQQTPASPVAAVPAAPSGIRAYA